MKQKLHGMKIKPNWKKVKFLLLSFVICSFTYAQDINVAQFAGGGEMPSPIGMDAAASWNVGNPYALVMTDNGDLYIGDYRWGAYGILKIDAETNEITEFMREAGMSTGDGGPVQKATTNDGIYGMALDCDGNIYFSDQSSGVVRKIDMTTGYVSLVAGNYQGGDVIDGALATETPLGTPAGITFNDDCSKMWIADYADHYVYEVDMNTGILNIIAGTGDRAESGDGVLAINSGFKNPHSLLYHSPEAGVEHLYIITYNKTMSRMDLNSGVLTRFAGNAGWCLDGDGGLAVEACFRQGVGLTLDPEEENLYFGDRSGVGIRRINLANERIFAFAGSLENSGEEPLFGDGGPADEARVKRGAESVFDANGDFIFAETGGPGYIRKVDMSTGLITTLAGDGTEPLPQDLEGILAVNVNNLNATAVLENDGIVYIADNNNNIIRMVDQDGVISTYAGEAGESSYTGGGHIDTVNFGSIQSMIWNADGSMMYIADSDHDVVYSLDMGTGMVEVEVGTGSGGLSESGGMGDTTQIKDPYGLSLYGDTLFWVERGNHIARKVDVTNGMVYHVAGVPGERSDDFVQTHASEAKFRNLSGIAVDPATGDVYMATDRRDRITRVDAETDTVYMFKDGFSNPRGLTFDPDGSLFVSDATEGLKVYDITTGEMEFHIGDVGNSYNAFVGAVGVFVASQTDGVYYVNMQEDAITMIDGYADASDASEMTARLVETAGVDRIMYDYIQLYRDSVEARDTIYFEALQNLVNNANQDTIFKVIQSLADADDASPLMQYHLEYTGITNIVEENLQAYRDAVAAVTSTDIAVVADLQTLIDDTNTAEANDALTQIQAMATAADATDLTVDLMVKAGVEGAVDMDTKFLDAYKAAVAGAGAIADLAALQTLVDDVNATLTLENIQMMADADDASTLTIEMLEDVGVTGAVEARLMYYQEAVAESDAATLVDAAAVQTLVNEVNADVDAAEAALATIDSYADASDASMLTIVELENAWADNVDAANIEEYKAEVASRDTIASYEDLQALVDLVNQEVEDAQQAAALTAIQGYADADDASAMTADELATAGADNVETAYIAEYQLAVEADSSENLVNADSLQKFIVDPVNWMFVEEAVDSIAEMARDDDAADLSHALLFQAELTNHGSNRILDSLRSRLETADIDSAAVSTQEKIQTLLNEINEEIVDADVLDEIRTMATTNDASGLELTMFEELDLTFDYYNYTVYQDSIEARDAIADVADLQAMIDAADVAAEEEAQTNALTAINQMAIDSDASGLTRDMLVTALGGDALLGKTLRHFELYQDSIAGQDGIADVAALEAVVESANTQAGIEVIQSYAAADDAAAMTGGELATAGVEGSTILTYNIEAYQDSVAGSTTGDVATTAQIQGLVNEVNVMENEDALNLLLSMSNQGDTSMFYIDLFRKAVVDYRDADYAEAYKVAIYDADALTTLEELQAVVDVVNALEYIKEMPGTNDADDLTVEMLLTAGVPAEDVVEANLDAYKFEVFDAEEIADLDALITLIQETNVQVTLDKILAMAGGDASELTVDMLEFAGVPSEDLYPDYLGTYKSEIEAKPLIPDLDRLIVTIQEANEKAALAEIQDMAGSDASGLSTDLLALAGVPQDDIIPDNLTAYQDSIEAVSSIAGQNALIDLIQGVNDRITNINPLALQNNIILYPNPSKGLIEFNFGKLNSHVFEVKVTDITGKVIVTRDLSVMKNKIDLTEYSSGIYFIQVTLDNVSITKRIVLE